jgi:hypothetical protein
MPVKDVADTNSIVGVSVTARLLDTKFQIKNKFISYQGYPAK